MAKKILFVDDEPNILQSIRRTLRSKFEVETAEGGEEALTMLRANGGYAVIVSDMRMPGMNGVELLTQVKQELPDTVRLMLTGNADQETAVAAVNHGDIFRFLNKPCAPDTLAEAVTSALRQYELITAEKDLLENTLRGSIKALADVLSLTNPEVFGRTARFKNQVREIAEQMGLEDVWQLESVAMLSQIGSVAIPEDLVKRKLGGHPLPKDELAEFAAHANIGADLLMTIPRMENVAEAIRYQEKNFDGSGYPQDSIGGEAIPLGARVMKVVLDFDAFESSGAAPDDALHRLKQQAHYYDPAVLSAFEERLNHTAALTGTTVAILKLTDGMMLAEDVRTAADLLLVAKGQETTLSVRRHLSNFRAKKLIGDTVEVWSLSSEDAA